MLKNLVLGLAASGWSLGLCNALACGFLWRRADVSFKEFYWAGSKVASYPERYVRQDRVLIARVLNFVAMGAILTSVLIMVSATVWPLFR